MEFTTTTETKDTEQVFVNAVIADAEIRDVPHTRSGRRWRPETIHITWARTRTGDGDWSAWETYNRATITGPIIRKDGSPGVSEYIARYLSEKHHEFGEWITASRPKEAP